MCGLFSWKELKWFSLVLNVDKNTIAVCISTNSRHSDELLETYASIESNRSCTWSPYWYTLTLFSHHVCPV